LLALVLESKIIKLQNTIARKVVSILSLNSYLNYINTLAFSLEGKMLVSILKDRIVQIWDIVIEYIL
jgi:WD40 repeat protein